MNTLFCHRTFAGCTISIQNTIYDTIKYGIYKGMYSIQFFLGSYISMKRRQVSQTDIIKSNTLLKHYPMHLYTHLPYVHNLCGCKGKLVTEDIETEKYVDNVITSIVYEINTISKLIEKTVSQGGCVLHIGSIGKESSKDKMKQALDIVIQSINKIGSKLEKGNAKLLLETMVGRGGVIGTNFEQLKYIFDNIEEKYKNRVGICIDTCHIFSEGLYKLDSIENIDLLFNDYKKNFPIETLNLIHLNDSKEVFNCKQDRHFPLLEGYIWKPNTLFYFIDKLEELKIPYVLETTETDYPLLQN